MMAPLDRFGLIDQHHGDIVLDPIAEAAGVAQKRLLLLAVLELAPTLRAHEDLQQLGIE
jgi:hypothetical protein